MEKFNTPLIAAGQPPEAMQAAIKAAVDNGHLTENSTIEEAFFVLRSYDGAELRTRKHPVQIPTLSGIDYFGKRYTADDVTFQAKGEVFDSAFTPAMTFTDVLAMPQTKEATMIIFDRYTATIHISEFYSLHFKTSWRPRADWCPEIRIEGWQLMDLRQIIS